MGVRAGCVRVCLSVCVCVHDSPTWSAADLLYSLTAVLWSTDGLGSCIRGEGRGGEGRGREGEGQGGKGSSKMAASVLHALPLGGVP